MKMRFSNELDYAFTFEASSIDEFREQAISAMRSYRIATEKRVHRGELRKTVSLFYGPQLHIYDENISTWLNLGLIRSRESNNLGHLEYWEPLSAGELPFGIFPSCTYTDTIEEIHLQDEQNISEKLELIWQAVIDTCRWSMGINTTIMSLDDHLKKEKEKGDDGRI